MVEAYGRSINSRKEKLEYEPYQIREHETRENRKISTPYYGLSIQTTSNGSARKTGYCASEVQNSDLCARLFLAPSYRV